jgi:hypothetical protein
VYVRPSVSNLQRRLTYSINQSLCQAVRQTVRIVSIDHPQNLLRTGDRATVIFEFIAHPEFVKAGMKLLFREGKTKVGVAELFGGTCHEIDGSCRVLVLSRSSYKTASVSRSMIRIDEYQTILMSFFRLYYRVYFRLVVYRMHNVRRLSIFSYVSSISLVL